MNQPRLKALHRRAWLLLALGATVVLSAAGPAPAANGDNLATFIADRGAGNACASIDAAGNHGWVGTGIAFNGTNLLLTCWSSNQVAEVKATDGSYVATHTIAGGSDFGAIAWDNGRGGAWVCQGFSQVGFIDWGASTYTPAFGVPGCVDGLAYDGSDDTIWVSPDVSGTVYHYTITGTFLASFPVSLGGYGNSGIAVGGPNLYLANNGGSQIYEVAKDFSTSTLFATFPRRLEDLECDNVTFLGAGKAAIWSVDAYDNILNAWEIPNGACTFGGGGEPPPSVEGFMTGGGSVFTSAGMRVTHGFELNCDAAKGPNNLQVNWGKGNRFHLTGLTSAACSDDASISEEMPVAGFDTYTGKGTGDYNGMPGATAEWTFTDAGEPGTADSVSLTIKDAGGNTVLSVTGALRNGNQQAHAS